MDSELLLHQMDSELLLYQMDSELLLHQMDSELLMHQMDSDIIFRSLFYWTKNGQYSLLKYNFRKIRKNDKVK